MSKNNYIANVRPELEPDLLEIALMKIALVIGRNRVILVSSLIVGGVVGFAVSFLFPKEYTSMAQVLPELRVSDNSARSYLTNFTGLSLSSNGERESIRPDLYPNVITSIPGLVHLLRQPVETVSKKKYKSLLNYFEETEKIKVSKGEIESLSIPTDNIIWHFNKEEDYIIQKLKDRIKINYDKKSGVIVIQTEMPDAGVSAVTLANIIDYLQKFVVEYRSDKKKERTAFVQSRLSEARIRLDKSARALQSFRDSNRNIVSNVSQIQEQKLQSEYSGLKEIYEELVNQNEKALMNELQVDPVLKVMNPPFVSLENSSPNRIFYVLGGSVIALFVGIGFLMIPRKLFF